MANAQVTPWVRIAPDGTITILSAGAEMGQGSMTNLPMIVAEEMDADWSKVAIEMAPADAGVYGYMMNNNQRMMAIVGSRATMLYYNDLRTAGAQVRKVLLANAAEKLGRRRRDAAHRAGRRHQSGERPAADLWRDRGLRQGAVAAAEGRRQGAQAPQGLAADRQGRAAPRHAARRSTAPPPSASTSSCRGWSTPPRCTRRCTIRRRRAGTTPRSRRCRASSAPCGCQTALRWSPTASSRRSPPAARSRWRGRRAGPPASTRSRRSTATT